MRFVTAVVLCVGFASRGGWAQESTREIFAAGQTALSRGDLPAAEAAFRKVLTREPQSVSALANLGVVAMRSKNWEAALADFRKAERLAPENPGLDLNIGLALFRMGKFEAATQPFRAVLKGDPSSTQAKYLLGLCLFATEKYGQAADALTPLWDQQKDQMAYLYMLAMCASKASREPLEQQALAQLYKVGNGSAEYHLFLGRAWLTRQHAAEAEAELKTAAQTNPKLPYVHYSLGIIYSDAKNYTAARHEFLADAVNEPNFDLNYLNLGLVYSALGDQKNATANYLEALRLNSRSVAARLGLAKIERSEGLLSSALARLDAAAKIEPENASVHYLRAQLLSKTGRTQEADAEFAISAKLRKAHANQLEEEVLGSSRLVDTQLAMPQ